MRIMLAYDGSSGADTARDLAASLPWPDGSAITVVTALERGDVFGAPEFALAPQSTDEAEAQLLAEIQEMLAMAAAPIRAEHRQIETRIVRGRPASTLHDEAEALQPDLIIIGTRGHGPFATLLMGSVSTEVVDHAPCPVLVARRPGVRRLVIGADGSESGQRAIDVFCSWPAFRGMPATVVAVSPPTQAWRSAAGSVYPPAMVEHPEAAPDERRAQLSEVAARAEMQLTRAGLPTDVEVREGDPAEQLIVAAGEREADLIVVGSRGLSTIPRLLLGSVARKVLLHADTSVLIVREPRAAARAAEPVAKAAAGSIAVGAAFAV